MGKNVQRGMELVSCLLQCFRIDFQYKKKG